MFKHHRLDAILSLISLLQVALLMLPFVVDVSSSQLILLVLINLFLIGTNYQCVAHNFIHNPFFKNHFLNQVFSVLNSLCIGIPESVYRIHHLEHHRHNNNPAKDESSTYKYGKNGKEENIFLYSTLGVLRTDLVSLYKTALKQSSLVHIEFLILSLFIAVLSIINWKLFLGYVLASYVFGQVFALWENYCEHHHADFSDRKRDSVSCYNSIYNFIWFNNGYHQEHHYSPTTHWTKISSIKEKLPNDRVVVGICHLTNSFSPRKPGLNLK